MQDSESVRATHCIGRQSSIRCALKKIEEGEDRICFVIDGDGTLARVITDGDIRRALLRGQTLDDSVLTVHDRTPVVAREGNSVESVRNLFSKRINVVPLLDHKGHVVGLSRQYDNPPIAEILSRKITIIGLGYVGLTLALVLAERGFHVLGYDIDSSLIEKLKRREVPFFENQLELIFKNVWI